MSTRLVLGTAQLGRSYGIAGAPMISASEGRAILALAQASGVTMLDTAPSYGDAETRLGSYGLRTRDHVWDVITKLPPIPEDCADVAGWVQETVRGSLQRLTLPQLQALLLHRPLDLLGPHGDALSTALRLLQRQQLVKAVGVSIQSPDELDALWESNWHFPIDLVQAPFNVLDRRLETSGWLARLQQQKIRVHARSVFLQGLLLLPVWPEAFAPWGAIREAWWAQLDAWNLTPVQACLDFVQQHPSIEKMVVGVDSLTQWEEILHAVTPRVYPSFGTDGALDLITPSRWRTR
jgi:aryl-alcohol dehydrogenase-like predicted oxidoreductase